MYIRPSLSMFPQLGMDGGMPSPRKSSAAMSSSENANVNVAWTMIGDIMFGRRCRRMMSRTFAPDETAASTYASSRTFSVRP